MIICIINIFKNKIASKTEIVIVILLLFLLFLYEQQIKNKMSSGSTMHIDLCNLVS